MKSFNVTFHKEDDVDTMLVQKLTEQEFEHATVGGTRRLFELDTNVGFFVFFDGQDKDGDLSYLMLQYEEDSEDPKSCYSFEMKDFYEFITLYLQGVDDFPEDDEEDDSYGPIHHLAHLLFHVAEEGESINLE